VHCGSRFSQPLAIWLRVVNAVIILPVILSASIAQLLLLTCHLVILTQQSCGHQILSGQWLMPYLLLRLLVLAAQDLMTTRAAESELLIFIQVLFYAITKIVVYIWDHDLTPNRLLWSKQGLARCVFV
jgi:hypothetical protein